MAWKTLSSKEVYKGKWMSVTDNVAVNDFGKEITWSVLHKKPFALIVPWDGEKFILVGVDRYASHRLSWEFPAGAIDEGDPLEGARRELKEESGFTAQKISLISRQFIANGHSDQEAFVYLATELIAGEQTLEEAEMGMQVKRFACDELRAMIADGTITDTITVSAFGVLAANSWLKAQGL